VPRTALAPSGRFPELDSLRALAALAVMGWHFTRELPFPNTPLADTVRGLFGFHGHGGRLGIVFFFLLSGYLITWRLLGEWRRGRFSLLRFLARRALRIWPLYFAVLVVGFAFIPMITRFAGTPVVEDAPWWLYALFLANVSMLWHGDPAIGTLGVQWSVSIEEQFYMLWPLLLLLLRRPWLFIAAVAIIVLLSHCFAMNADARTAYFHLLGNLRYLGLGALLGALITLRGDAVEGLVRRVPAIIRNAFIVLMPLSVMLLYAWAGDLPPRVVVSDSIAIGAFGLVLLERSFASTGMLRLDAFKPLPWLGTRSYGLYLLHMPAIALARWITAADPSSAAAAIALAVLFSCLFADLGYRLIEQPFLRMKQQLS